MCELFAMSSRYPATVTMSLTEFARHGGQTDHHKDGWGVAFFEGPDALVVREPDAAAKSAGMDFVRSHARASDCVISHIRKATMGGLSLRNTQPFCRELAGRKHIFVHNGMLSDVFSKYQLEGCYHPVGETDSEVAFCVLMDRMAALWRGSTGVPSDVERLAVFSAFAAEFGTFGPANFIYSDGDIMFAHGHRRSHADGIHPPGLHYLCRSCKTDPTPLDAEGLSIVTEANTQDIVLLASVPLTDESWTPMAEGQVLALRGGKILDLQAI